MYAVMHRHPLLLALVALTAACSAQSGPASAPTAEPVAATVPKLRISDAMEPEYQEAALGAAEDWTARGIAIETSIVPDREANVRAGDCSALSESATACAWAGSDILLVVEEIESCRWAKIDGVTTCVLSDVRSVVRHELGHWLGFMEHLDDGNVMQPHYPTLGFPTELTDADVEAVRGVR